jgi:hypothetical protein
MASRRFGLRLPWGRCHLLPLEFRHCLSVSPHNDKPRVPHMARGRPRFCSSPSFFTNGRMLRMCRVAKNQSRRSSWRPITQIDRSALALFARGAMVPGHGWRNTPLPDSPRINFNPAEPREDHGVLKLPCPRIAGARGRHGARGRARARRSAAIGLRSHERHRPQAAFRIPLNGEDDMIGPLAISNWFQIVR